MSFSAFQQIIRDPETCGGRRLFEIKEKDINSKLKKVIIRGFENENAVKFCFDGDKDLSPYLSQTGDHLKACDAVVLVEFDDNKYLIFLEMKSESLDKERIMNQFKSSICFMDYCSSILKIFHSSHILDQCEKRFVVFHLPRPITKTATRPLAEQPSCDKHDKPENPLYLPYAKPVRIRKII